MPNVAYTIRSVPMSICPRSLYVGESASETVVFAAFMISLTWGTALTCISSSRLVFAGKMFSGYMWVIQTVLGALSIMICKRGKMTFPFYVWLPWLMWITVRCDFGDFGSVQRTAMLWAVPIVGAATSMVIVRKEHLEWLLKSIVIIVLFSAAVFLIYELHLLPKGVWTGTAASTMTLCLAASYFAPYVFEGRLKYVLLWSFCAAICIFSTGRTATAVCLLTLPLSPARVPLLRRLLLAYTVVFLGLLAFSIPATRVKFSYSGEVSLVEVLKDPSLLNTTGRLYMWELLWEEAWKNPVFGAGGNAHGHFGEQAYGTDNPHNDYIRVFFDYGLLGLLLLGVPMVYTLAYTYLAIRVTNCRLLRDAYIVCCGGFISMCLLAITDNVILYIAYFGCLLFGILGAAHGVSAAERRANPAGDAVLRTRVTHA